LVTVGGAQNLAGSRNIATRGTDARELCKEEWFLEELSLLNSDGEPLFKPGMSLRARASTEEKWVRYDQACSAADNLEDILFVYLVDLDRE
jgi:hypothetical protein